MAPTPALACVYRRTGESPFDAFELAVPAAFVSSLKLSEGVSPIAPDMRARLRLTALAYNSPHTRHRYAMMRDPVRAADGHVYDRAALVRHMATNGLASPLTRETMTLPAESPGLGSNCWRGGACHDTPRLCARN